MESVIRSVIKELPRHHRGRGGGYTAQQVHERTNIPLHIVEEILAKAELGSLVVKHPDGSYSQNVR